MYLYENRGTHTLEIWIEDDHIVRYYKWSEDHFIIERMPIESISAMVQPTPQQVN